MNKLLQFGLKFRCFYRKDNHWKEVPVNLFDENGFLFQTKEEKIILVLNEWEQGYNYSLLSDFVYDTEIRLIIESERAVNAFHLIPGNIYGDNNIQKVKPGEYPSLTNEYSGKRFCSPVWEFRADRAPIPLSAMCFEQKTVCISISPYSDTEGTNIHNGLFAELPASIGVTLGYQNIPCTFIDKGKEGATKNQFCKKAVAEGSIYFYESGGKKAIHVAIRREYEKLHTRALYQKSYVEAANALVRTMTMLSWNEEWRAYTDMMCRPEGHPELKPDRPIYEIGWTGIAELACPLIMAEVILPLSKADFSNAMSGEQLINKIIGAYSTDSGFLYDLVSPIDKSSSLVNGWWADYPIASDCHCAYTNGKAVHSILKSIYFLKNHKKAWPEQWLAVSIKVLETILRLQHENGNYGYTYSTVEKRVLDWNGFAGCWFVPCMAYAYYLTRESKYLISADKAIEYYSEFVNDLNCYGTPMDTWKAVDEEGNLAFIRGARLLHEFTGESRYLKMLEAGAEYEYLWRYGYAARPDYPPIKNGWNSCGGSITSVSNPHIHPMGVLVNDDLLYLADQSKDNYHQSRAADGIAWLMQTLECYPLDTGYGQYGVVSERWCPSDGLIIEEYESGKPYSSWFSYNAWSAGNMLEALMDILNTKI